MNWKNFKSNLNEDNHAWATVQDVAKRHSAKNVKYKGGKSIKLDAYSASALVAVHKALKKKKNQDSFVNTINSSPQGLKKMVDFAFKMANQGPNVKTRPLTNPMGEAKSVLHGIKSDPAYKKAKTDKQLKKAIQQWNLKNPKELWVGESVELDEGKQLELLKKYGTTIMKMWDTDGASSDEIAKKLKLNSKDTKTLKGLMDESVELDEGKKTYKVQSGIGKSKHTVSFHDGKKKHKDGSPFYDIKIFKNQTDLKTFTTNLVKKGYRTESVELGEASQRFGGDTNIPADKKTKGYIESGRAKILLNVQSSLHPSARFVVAKNPNAGSNQDKVMMFTISDPDRSSRIKMFSFHGSHVSHQKAMDFAKKHKLVATKDAKANPLYAKESVEEGAATQAVLKKLKMRKFDRDERKTKKEKKKSIRKYQKMVGIPITSSVDEAKKYPHTKRVKGKFTAVALEVNKDYPTGKWTGNMHSLEDDMGIWKTAAMALQRRNKKSGSKINVAIEDDKGKVVKIFKESVGKTWNDFVENKLYPEPKDPKKNLKNIENPLAGKGYPYNESVIEEEPQSGTFKGRAVNKANSEFKKAKAELDVKIADIQGKLDSIDNKREAGRKVSSLEAKLAAVRKRKKAAQEKIAQATERIKQSKARLAQLRGETNEEAPANSAGDGSSIAGLDDEPPVRKKKKKLDARTREFKEKTKSLANARTKRERIKLEKKYGFKLNGGY